MNYWSDVMKQELTKEKILQAALECFCRKGYINTSMNDIIAAAQVSKGGIYWHFKSKEEIFVQIIEADYAEWLALLDRELDKLSDPVEKIRKYGYLFYSLIDKSVWQMLPESYWGELGEHYRDRLNICYEKDDRLLRDLFLEAIRRNMLKETDADALTWIYISTLEGLYAKLSLGLGQRQTLESYFKLAVDLFIQSIELPE